MTDIYNAIHVAIVQDDVKALGKLLTSKERMSVRFGRFPILTLAYLYHSQKIILKFGKTLEKIYDYTVVEEHPEDYLKFKRVAGKSLRLYLDGSVVSPTEISAILGNSLFTTHHLTLDSTYNEKVKKIYRLSHSTKLKEHGGKLRIPRNKRPSLMQFTAFVVILVICMVALGGALLALNIVPKSMGGSGTKDSPIKITSQQLLQLANKESQSRYYLLENDLTIDLSTWETRDIAINILGNGKTLTINGALNKPLFNKITGSVSDLNVVFNEVGGTIPPNNAFFANELSGNVNNVNVTYNDFDLTFTEDSALFIYSSTGNLNGVNLTAKGNITENSGSEEALFGSLLFENKGVVADCNVNLKLQAYGDARLINAEGENQGTGDAVIGGIIGVNNGNVVRSKVQENSEIIADSIDVGGIAVENANKATISECINYATITQTSPSTQWNPTVGGITLRNSGKIIATKNYGALTVSSIQTKTELSIVTGGITTTNHGTIDKCENLAPLTANATFGSIYIGGIGYLNEGIVTASKNEGSLNANALESDKKSLYHYLGGAFAFNNNTISNFKNTGNINYTAPKSYAYLGGVVGVNNAQTALVDASQNRGNFNVQVNSTDTVTIAGGIAGFVSGKVTNSFSTATFTHNHTEEQDFWAGGIIGITLYTGTYISHNYYLGDKGADLGIFALQYEDWLMGTKYYEGTDDGANPKGDIEAIKSTGVYWE
ncbi:MAG: hypothetical protein J6V83_01630 [Clostridia bacterium]|nr:hypothetical protein [Clostridia bacterium]